MTHPRWLSGHLGTKAQALVQAVVRRGIDYSLINPASTATYSKVLINRAKTGSGRCTVVGHYGRGPRPQTNLNHLVRTRSS